MRGFKSFELSLQGFDAFEFVFKFMLGFARPKNEDFVGVFNLSEDFFAESFHVLFSSLEVAFLIDEGQELIRVDAAVVFRLHAGRKVREGHVAHFIRFNDVGFFVVDPNTIEGGHKFWVKLRNIYGGIYESKGGLVEIGWTLAVC